MVRAALSLAFALALASPALAGTPVALRAAPAASGPQVTLGDLFDGVIGPAATVPVGPAPAPGLNVVLDAGRVQLAAKGAGLDWDNPAGVRRIVVGAGAAIAEAAPRAGATRASARPAARVQALAYARNIAAGEIVQAADLVWSDQVIAPSNAPGDPDAVIGQAARRPLRAGAAVVATDLSAPVAVHRNETIMVAYEAPGMSLVLQGQALKDASVGETVQVLNTQSKKTIEAVVSGPGKALVGPRAQALKARAFSTASIR
jgi:flagella basal body P-ring formation protein FlgA